MTGTGAARQTLGASVVGEFCRGALSLSATEDNEHILRKTREALVITRIVRMTFDPAHIADFEALFQEVSEHIRATDGCHSVLLLRDVRYPNVMSTISQWEDLDALAAYRRSAFFEKTWSRTRQMFAAPPEAASYKSA